MKTGFAREGNAVLKNHKKLQELCANQASLEEIVTLHSSILADSTRLKQWAGNRVKKAFLGKYAWSPEWQEYKLPVLLWEKVVKRFDGTVRPKYLPRLMNKCNEPGALRLTKAQAQLKLEAAKEDFAAR